MPKVKRHVIGTKENKMSGVIYSNNPEYQEVPQIFWRTTLWNTTELPVENTIGGDRASHDCGFRHGRANHANASSTGWSEHFSLLQSGLLHRPRSRR